MDIGAIRSSIVGFLRGLGEFFLDTIFQTRRRNRTVAEMLRDQLNDKRVLAMRLAEQLEQESRAHETTRLNAAKQLEEANGRAMAASLSNELLRARVSALEDTVNGLRRQLRRKNN